MSQALLARKGEANPAATHHGGESRFQAQRIVVLPPIALHRASGWEQSCLKNPRRAANMAKPFRASVKRRKFTFRLERPRHAEFCEAADRLGISRQELLTRALDSYLGTLRDEYQAQPAPGSNQPLFDTPGSHDTAHTLLLPF